MTDKMELRTINVGYIGTNCYLAMNENTYEGIIVDPGHECKKITAAMSDMGMKPVAILLTHGHFDHIMAVNELKAEYPDICIYAAEAEHELLGDAVLNCSDGLIHQPYTTAADILVNDQDKIKAAGFEIEVIATPGHTAGGVCYHLRSEKLMFSGDTLFYGSVGRTDLPTGNFKILLDSLKTKLAVLDEDTEVYPGHGPMTTIGTEKQINPQMLMEL